MGIYARVQTQVTEVAQRYLNECVNTRDKLQKFMGRLDTTDAVVKPHPG